MMPSREGKSAGYLCVVAPIVLLGTIVLLAPTRAAAHFKITDPTTPPQPATVPLADIQAVARQVWFSSQRGEGVRWGRIGTLLR